jgi:hypothetical protein
MGELRRNIRSALCLLPDYVYLHSARDWPRRRSLEGAGEASSLPRPAFLLSYLHRSQRVGSGEPSIREDLSLTMLDPRLKPWRYVYTKFLQGGVDCHEGRRQEMG